MAEAASDIRSVLDAAEQAASVGDHGSAERLLREVARLQETTLGALHPDLANTLNNLGIVCENAGKPADAEQCYRRACAIATASLAPDHAFVSTSRKNLVDFCNARGIAVDPPVAVAPPPPPPQARPSPPAPQATPSLRTPQTSPPPRAPQPAASRPAPQTAPRPRATPPIPVAARVEVTAGRSSRTLLVVAVVVGGLALAIFIALRPGVSPTEDAAPTSSSAPSTTEQTQALPEPTAGPDAPDPVTPPPAPEPVTLVAPAPTAASRTGTEVATDTPAPRPSGSVPAVVSAQLCRNAPAGEAWQCDPASGPLDPGALFFYTRIAATSDTLVEHRWYRGDRLHQTVPLRIRANAGGFRTFSRNTVSPERAGDWKVELRAQDGTVLHEERFSVR